MDMIPMVSLAETTKRGLFGLLASADIIWGVDSETGNEFLVYGRDWLKAVTETKQGEHLLMTKVLLRQSTLELETLLAAVTVVKGHHDYEACLN
jgi:hypothetical protein